MKLRVLYLMTGLILIATLSLSAQTTEVKPADIKKKAIKKEKVTQPSTSDTKGTAVKTEVKQSAKSTEVKGTKSEKGSSKKGTIKEDVKQSTSGTPAVNPVTGKKPKTKKEKQEMEIKARQAADEAKAKAEAGKNTVASGVKLVSRTQVESFEEVLTKGNFKIKSFTLTCKVNGVVKSYKSSDGEITKEMKQAVSQLKKGEQFTLENVKVHTRKGLEKTIDKQVYQLTD